jgi:hypothetical protein
MHFRNIPAIWIKELFIRTDLSHNITSFPVTFLLVLIVPLFSWFSNLIARSIILKLFYKPAGDGQLTLSKMNLTI